MQAQIKYALVNFHVVSADAHACYKAQITQHESDIQLIQASKFFTQAELACYIL